MTNQLASLEQRDHFYLDPFSNVNLGTYIKNLSTYETNTLRHGKFFVRFLFNRCLVSENSFVRCAHSFVF